jgi:DNA-binding response OmpR family regulator
VDSREGSGATFTVELPATRALAPEPAEKPLLRTEQPATEPGPRSEAILVVEDEPTVAQLIADVLSEEGYPVDTVLDSREGLELVPHKPYELVICDLRMPHLDGRGFYRELMREASPLAHRLVFVTGDTLGPRTVEFLEASGVPYLAKPFLVEELKEVVYSALASASQPVLAAASQLSPRGRMGTHRRHLEDHRKGNHHE